MNLVRVNVHYSGRVQGVGFRYIVKSLVPGYEVLGTVKNLPDGRVEMVAEGQQVELEYFLQAIRDSGLRRNIQDEELVWGEAEDKFRGFNIIGWVPVIRMKYALIADIHANLEGLEVVLDDAQKNN